MSTTKACGGCGATKSSERCIGCTHDFGDDASAWVRTPTPLADAAAIAEREAYVDQHHRDSAELRRLCAARDQAQNTADALAKENDALRRALGPFARLVSTDKLSWAMVEYCVEGDPEKQTFQHPQMQRAFNRAAEAYRAALATTAAHMSEDAYVAKRMTETLAEVYATILGDDTPDQDASINAIERVKKAAQVLRLEVDLYRAKEEATLPDSTDCEGCGYIGMSTVVGTRCPRCGSAPSTEAAMTDAIAPTQTYTTQPGESVAGIALRQCGNEAEWRHILACNPKFADMLPHEYFPVGTVLTMPAPSPEAPAVDALTTGAVAQWQSKLREPILPSCDVWVNVSEEAAKTVLEKYSHVYKVRALYERAHPASEPKALTLEQRNAIAYAAGVMDTEGEMPSRDEAATILRALLADRGSEGGK